MPRNKYPERTVARILEVAEQVFTEKGYADTKVMDIVNALKGEMTRGAVQHHFKSKQQMFNMIYDKKMDVYYGAMAEAASREDLNGREKLIEINNVAMKSVEEVHIVKLLSSMTDGEMYSDFGLTSVVVDTIEEKLIPLTRGVVDEGIADGSIVCDNPEDLTETYVYAIQMYILGRIPKHKPEKIMRMMSFVSDTFAPFWNEPMTESSWTSFAEEINKEYVNGGAV